MAGNINQFVGARVRAARSESGMSMREVVAKLHNPITTQQFANYERGVSRWPVDLLCDVARLLNLNIKELCNTSEKES